MSALKFILSNVTSFLKGNLSGLKEIIWRPENPSFLSNRRLRGVLDGMCSREYTVNVGVSQGSILGPTFFLLYINHLFDDVICNIANCPDDTTLYAKCDQASDLY